MCRRFHVHSLCQVHQNRRNYKRKIFVKNNALVIISLISCKQTTRSRFFVSCRLCYVEPVADHRAYLRVICVIIENHRGDYREWGLLLQLSGTSARERMKKTLTRDRLKTPTVEPAPPANKPQSWLGLCSLSNLQYKLFQTTDVRKLVH